MSICHLRVIFKSVVKYSVSSDSWDGSWNLPSPLRKYLLVCYECTVRTHTCGPLRVLVLTDLYCMAEILIGPLKIEKEKVREI